MTLEELRATSLDTLLRFGADGRVIPDASGLNRYGTSTQVRTAIPFGSCTASSPSARARRAADGVHTRLAACSTEAELTALAETLYREMREQLQYLLMLDRVPGTEVIFTPSGTDAELVLSHLALGDGTEGLVNIVV